MNHALKTKLEYWVRFICAALVFGFAGAVGALQLMNELPWLMLTIGWIVTTLSAALIAARHGDSVWIYLIRWFTCVLCLLGLKGP